MTPPLLVTMPLTPIHPSPWKPTYLYNQLTSSNPSRRLSHITQPYGRHASGLFSGHVSFWLGTLLILFHLARSTDMKLHYPILGLQLPLHHQSTHVPRGCLGVDSLQATVQHPTNKGRALANQAVGPR